MHSFPVHLQVWRRRISACSSHSSQHQRRRNPTSLIITCEPELESRHRQVLIYSEPRQTGCSTLPSDVTNKAQSQQIEAIHYSWLFPPKPLPVLMTQRQEQSCRHGWMHQKTAETLLSEKSIPAISSTRSLLRAATQYFYWHSLLLED